MALADPRVTESVVLVRCSLLEHPKLRAPVVGFERLRDDADWWRADAMICALSTNTHVAGSPGAFC